MTVVLAPLISGAPALHVETPSKLQNRCILILGQSLSTFVASISIGLSLSDEASKTKFLNIERA